MIHNFIEKYIATMNGVFWTLPFEWQFYLIFPCLFIVLRRYGAWVLYGSVLIGVIGTLIGLVLGYAATSSGGAGTSALGGCAAASTWAESVCITSGWSLSHSAARSRP